MVFYNNKPTVAGAKLRVKCCMDLQQMHLIGHAGKVLNIRAF